MVKKIIVGLLVFSISTAYAELVTDNDGNIITGMDLEVLLETAPIRVQKAMLGNRAKLKKQLEQLYLREKISQIAVSEGLEKESMNAARLEYIRNNALYTMKLKALGQENKRDYSKYARQIYLVHKTDYPVEERVDVGHILISTKELSDVEALEKAKKIRFDLLQGADFADLATKLSDDKSVEKNHGELGVFTRDKIAKPFADVAFIMQKGEISEPVKTRYGYHIIKFNKKLPAGFKSFDEVEAMIINDLRKKDWNIAKEAFIAQVLKESEMQINEQKLDEFVEKRLGRLNP